ncbi:uncharacterized protein LOC111116827 isoform X2 [Crassostrea virginica]
MDQQPGMEERFELECNGATEMLQELFNFKLTRINEDPSQFSLCNNILKAIQIDDLLQDIRPPSRKDEVRGNYPSILDLVKPGSVFVFEVVVIPDKHGLQIKEKDGDDYIGTTNSRSYCCRSIFTVKRIKRTLVQHTLEAIAKLLGTEICRRMSKHIEEQIQIKLQHEFPDLKLDISLTNFNVFAFLFDAFIITIFWPIVAIVLAFSIVSTLLFSVNINDKLWRRSVALEIYHCIMENRNMLMYGILREIRKMCTRTISDLDKALKQLERFKDRMVLLNQQELITEWENRQIFHSEASIIELANDQSVLGSIAGRVNGKPAVKVFLQHDDKKAVSYVFKNCKYPENIHFMNVTEKLKVNAVREINKLAVASIDTSTRNLLHAIIQKEGERIMATHSTVVGIGISRIKDVGAPCIALFCLDKQLIPFGEHKIPEQIEGFPVDIREY